MTTDELVDQFATALKEKLRKAEEKYGFEDGWLEEDWEETCQRDFLEHVFKGDPLDVAAYCAFLWYHKWPTVAFIERAAVLCARFAVQYARDQKRQ